MSEVSDLIFKGEKHKLTSPYGKRNIITTSAGTTSSFHSGCDYATYSKKLAQYAIDDGEIISCGKDSAGGNALYIWVKYPTLGVKMLHYHLDKICVKKGQSVNQNTVLGYTGKTGKATGIHLHLGIKYLSGSDYIDGEKWSKEVYPTLKKQSSKDEKYENGSYIVTANLLNVRSGPSVSFSKKHFDDLSNDAQKKILSLTGGRKKNGYVKGVTFSTSEINGSFGKTPSGWVCLKYAEKI